MILALAGRRIDEANASYKRFPLSAVPEVRRKLKTLFTDKHVTHLVSSGACGADLLAQEVAGELGIACTIVLPFDSGSFRKTSVIDRPGNWGKIYDKIVAVLADVNRLVILGCDQEDSSAYAKTNTEILSISEGLSKRPDKSDVSILIVWEGKTKDSNDTTEALKSEALKRGLRILEINTLSE